MENKEDKAVKNELIRVLSLLRQGGMKSLNKDGEKIVGTMMKWAIPNFEQRTIDRQIYHFKQAEILPEFGGISVSEMHFLYKQWRRKETQRTKEKKRKYIDQFSQLSILTMQDLLGEMKVEHEE